MSKQIKAKFMCNTITLNGYGSSAALTAVYGKEGENADYAKATPCGTLQLSIDNDTPAADFFKPRKAYYVYFEEVPEEN